MRELLQQHEKPEVARPILRTAGLLQRKCACGGSPGVDGECEECRKRGMTLQRSPQGRAPVLGVPLIVHEVLRSPGQPLDSQTRAFFEPRFGHDFSKVRVHTDTRASESTRAVNALAYTVGQDVAFASGQYAPRTDAGARLLAHELAHTVQSPEPTGLFPSLQIGPADDPSEQMADRAADAVMRNEKISLPAAVGPVLRRQQRTCTAEAPAAGDLATQRRVRCSDNSRYRVTLVTAPHPASPTTRTTVNAGVNENDLYMTVAVCRGGTEVHITPHVDLPRAVLQALGNALAGSDALTGVTLSPGLRILIIQKESFTLSVDPNVQVGRSGVVGGGGSVTVQTPNVTVSGGGSYSSPTRSFMINFTITPGATQKSPDCSGPPQHAVFTCELISREGSPEVPEKSVMDEEVRYLFFKYPTAEIRRDFHYPPEPEHPSIKELYDQGFRFKSIEGFTSPEGPRGHENEPKFKGNIDLAQERADVALGWLRDEACPKCDFTGMEKPVGRSELPPELGKVVPEPKGPGMERAAVSEFLGLTPRTTPDPLAPKTPEELEAFRKLPASQQREQAFELMRRAKITMQHKRITQEHKPEVKEHDVFGKADCAKEVTDAARPAFGISWFTTNP